LVGELSSVTVVFDNQSQLAEVGRVFRRRWQMMLLLQLEELAQLPPLVLVQSLLWARAALVKLSKATNMASVCAGERMSWVGLHI